MSAAPSGSPLADLPADLPAPTQDGATKHLIGHPLPVLVELPCTRLTDPHPQSKAQEELEAAIDERGYVDLFNLALSRPVLLFIYPRTPLPSETLPDSWNATPGAGGCDAHVLSIPPLLTQLRTLEPDLQILGLSSQSNAEQQETADREKLELPTFEWEGRSWLKRATLYLRESQVVNLSYPVFPPESAGERALEMLRAYREQMDS
ncbi:unnamed protein product [Tilletia controversa]|uniref:Redoxin domain-containing protein n=1 Tax=Tilletia laevis TaxID=157183 RepID=A0A9N8QA87_9BASI|nr:unnamed protein product [Tilletia caries]CAD6915386.1 unnamed protein product [Tilletia laevis]CAD6932766.1 unnamed protein product [Tilletia controversa]CAD6931134.1 unnamed protein product [Tilletia laevis]CAD6974473.1 unnamed protein product [Tilletia controversa]